MNAVKEFFARHFGTRAVETVLSLEERFNSGSAISASALHLFDEVLADLDEANEHFNTVVQNAADEVARLTQLAQEAARQRGQNTAVSENVRRLLTPPAKV